MAPRRKKTKTDTDGKEATPKKSRSRKARGEASLTQAASAAGSEPAEQHVRENPLPSQDPTSDKLRVPLPGELYQRQNQWWWRVQLPGEDKPTARALQTDGGETPADGRGDGTPNAKDRVWEPDACVARTTAERTALAMWERAIEEDATRRIRMESTEKIERLKAQFLDKVRHFTELVETANANLEAEQRARAEAEAKLAQMIQAAEPTTGGTGTPAAEQCGWDPTPALGGHPEHVGPVPQPQDNAAGTRPSPSGVILFDRQPGAAVPPIEQAEPDMPTPIPTLPTPPLPIPVVMPSAADSVIVPVTEPPPPETGRCECCDATGVAVTHLTHIDSGQLLCPRCLAALRTDATRSA